MRICSDFFQNPILFCLLAAVAGTSRSEEPQVELPKASISFDDQTLWLKYSASDEGSTLMEFIPDGQTLEDWTHLAAIRSYHDARLGPRKRAAVLAAQVAKNYPAAPIDSQESPDAKMQAVSFAIWSAGELFVEFNVFVFATGSDGTDVGLQYAIRRKSTPQAFVEREYEPLRDRIVKLILREGLNVAKESDLTMVRLALSPAEQAICDTLGKDDAAGLKAVLESPDDRSATLLLVGAAIAFNRRQLEDSAFLFYAGQLRLRFDEKCFPPKKTEGQDPIRDIGSYSSLLGARINPAVMHEPSVFSKALARVARWQPQAPSEYRPGYEFDRRLAEEEARAAAEPNRTTFMRRMGDLATLLNDEEYFRADRIVNGLRLPDEDRLPTKEEFAAAKKTMARIEEEKGIVGFDAVAR